MIGIHFDKNDKFNILEKERCVDCDCVLATEYHFDNYKAGEGSHLCWRMYNNDICEKNRIDWRIRAMEAEEKLEKIITMLRV